MLTSLFTLGISVLSLAGITMSHLEKLVPIKKDPSQPQTLENPYVDDRPRGDTFAPPAKQVDFDPEFESSNHYTQLPSDSSTTGLGGSNAHRQQVRLVLICCRFVAS